MRRERIFGRSKAATCRRTAFRGAFTVFLCLVAGLSAAQTGGEGAAGLDRVGLQLKWNHQFQFAGYYAAVEKGFYQEAGLDVEIIEGGPNRRPIDVVMSGRAQYGVANAEILVHRLEGKPVVALAVVFQHSPSILLARMDSGIRSPQDLIGRRVMMREGIDSAELLATLLNEGIPLDSVTKVDMSYRVEDLIDGKVDAFHAYITNQPYVLKERGIPMVIIHPLVYGIDFYGDTLFTTEQEIAEHPKRVKAFREASLRGWDYAMQHPEEIIDVMLDRYPSEATRDLLVYEAKSMVPLIQADIIEIGHMNPGRWRHIADTCVSLGMVSPSYSLDGFLYDPNPRPDYTWVHRTVAALLGLAAVLFTSSLVLVLFNRRLHVAVQARTAELAQANAELEQHREHLEERVAERTRELSEAMGRIKTLHGLLPICSSCKKIRDDEGYWNEVEAYVQNRSDAHFSHSICPECAERLYPELYPRKRPENGETKP